jgi:glyceraldehyde 3-phosphate dehydrogenase
MAINVGINGFGRIGRNVVRAAFMYDEFKDFEFVGINDLTDIHTLTHLLKYDSILGRFNANVIQKEDGIEVNGKHIKITAIKDPKELPWKELGAEYVIESTGKFTTGESARGHLEAGARKVVISAPAKGEDVTIVMGVNEDDYDPMNHHILSNASCTTNCLAPVAKVILERFGILNGLVTTVHAYTNDQRLMDFPHSDLRRARAAALNMIPTKTGAAKAVSQVLPELAGKLDGMAIRVPTPDVSAVDLVVNLEKKASSVEINDALKASVSRFLGFTDEPLVSTDFLGDKHSAIVDGSCTKVINETLAKIIIWYDNEWGYSCRLLDLIQYIEGKKII